MTQISATKKNENIFSLCRLKAECKYPPISVDFNPILKTSQTYRPIMPHFNNDGKYYTPAFVNPYEQSLLKWSPEECQKNDQQKFIKKIEANKSKPEESKPFFNPKDDLYCSICRVSFDDYWKHIGSAAHHRKLIASLGDRYIREMCEPFLENSPAETEEKNKKRAEPKKTKKIKKKGKDQKPSPKLTINQPRDLIIKLPLELFSRQERAMQSTNGFTSQNQKL